MDYVSATIPVLDEGEELAPVKVVLYNLGEDTSRGAHVRSILADLGVAVETVAARPATGSSNTLGLSANGSRVASDQQATDPSEEADETPEAADVEVAAETEGTEDALVADDENPLAGNAAEDVKQNDLAWTPFVIASAIAVAGIVLVVRRRKDEQR